MTCQWPAQVTHCQGPRGVGQKRDHVRPEPHRRAKGQSGQFHQHSCSRKGTLARCRAQPFGMAAARKTAVCPQAANPLGAYPHCMRGAHGAAKCKSPGAQPQNTPHQMKLHHGTHNTITAARRTYRNLLYSSTLHLRRSPTWACAPFRRRSTTPYSTPCIRGHM